jgi:glycosyltransferase involved in cell wall biosynthesis
VTVLHVIPSISPLRGGPSMVIRTMVGGLVGRGAKVHVATTDDDGAGRFEGGRSTVESGGTYWFFPRQFRFYTFSWPLNRWLAEHIREYDVVHIHALFSYPATVAAHWARRYGLPYIVRPLGTLNRWGVENRRPWLKGLSLRMVERRILAGAAAVQFTSEQEEIEARDQGMVTRPVIIPNAVEFSDFRQDGAPGWLRARYPQLAGRKIALFLSRIDRKKGLDLLLSAFAEVRRQRPDAALVIVGNGDDAFLSVLRRQAQQLGIEGDVLWAGFLEGEQKVAALRESDVFVLPSYSENFGVAVVEAMACGLPVIVSDQVGIHRELSASDAALVVPCEKDRLAKAILQVFDDAALRSRLSQNGIAMSKTFSVEAVTDQLVDLYRDIISSHGAGK